MENATVAVLMHGWHPKRGEVSNVKGCSATAYNGTRADGKHEDHNYVKAQLHNGTVASE